MTTDYEGIRKVNIYGKTKAFHDKTSTEVSTPSCPLRRCRCSSNDSEIYLEWFKSTPCRYFEGYNNNPKSSCNSDLNIIITCGATNTELFMREE